MANSELDNHKVDHLFLLIGENPLPNYVAARLMLKEDGTVYMVHTTKTFTRFQLLEKQLKKFNIKVIPVSLGNAEADGYAIRKKIKEKIRHKGQHDGKLLLTGRIGLNYTGGTKAMSVHAYQAFIELGLTDCVFSYLDSRKLSMYIDKEKEPISIALALSPPPSLDEILALHKLSWNENNLPVSHSLNPSAAKNFVDIYMQKGSITKQWGEWCNVVFARTKDGKGYWKEDDKMPDLSKLQIVLERQKKLEVGEEILAALREQLQDKSENEINFIISKIKNTKKIYNLEIPAEIRNVLEHDLQCISEDLLSVSKVKDVFGVPRLSQACSWLSSGGWLEDYVFSQVEKVAEKYSLTEIKMSLHIKDPINKEDPDRGDQFEFDVVFLRGYQIFGISCTSGDNYQLCKQKLFEAYIRARQLGGDEARVALVCFSDKPTEQIKQELDFDTDDPKIEVFGRSDLEPTGFAKKLNDWIMKNIEEQENE
jgi:hypothetical protein